MTIRQLSVFAANQPGTLLEITDALGKAGVDIRAMSIADTMDFGIFRLIVNDIEKAKDALEGLGCVVSETPVIAAAISDEPGALNAVLKLLSENAINVEYMYAFIAVSKRFANVVLRVEDNEKAIAILKENGVKLVSDAEIQSL